MDAHFHIWDLGMKFFADDNFLERPENEKIRKNFSHEEFHKEMSSTPVTGAVFIQCANNCVEEAKWVCELAKHNPWIRGVVAGLTLDNKDQLLKEIGILKPYKEFCGVRRHFGRDEQANAFMKNPVLGETCQVLIDNNLTLDLTLYPNQLPAAIELAKKHRMLKIAVDHMAKPNFKAGGSPGWEENMQELAKCKNVYVKLSGMVTEASENQGWKVDDFKPFVQKVIEWFEPGHCMYGSDWPVSLINAQDYHTIYNQIVNSLPMQLRDSDIHGILQNNCLKFYRITSSDRERLSSAADDVDVNHVMDRPDA